MAKNEEKPEIYILFPPPPGVPRELTAFDEFDLFTGLPIGREGYYGQEDSK